MCTQGLRTHIERMHGLHMGITHMHGPSANAARILTTSQALPAWLSNMHMHAGIPFDALDLVKALLLNTLALAKAMPINTQALQPGPCCPMPRPH